MAILKRDVNFIFFILIIITVVSFAGFTTYYEASFRNISNEYDTKIAELTDVTQDLLEKKTILTETNQELDKTKEQVLGREKLYDDLRDERDDIFAERDALKENLFQTKAELSQKIAQVSDLSAQVVTLDNKVDDLQEEVEEWKDKRNECEDVAEGLGGSC